MCKVVLISAILLIISTFACGCGRQPAERSASEITSSLLNAAKEISNYELDSTLTDNFTIDWLDGPEAGSINPDIWYRRDQALVDKTDNATWFSYNINQGVDKTTPFVGQFYFVGGWEYHISTSPQVFEVGHSGPINSWGKTKVADVSAFISNITELTPLIQLVQTSSPTDLSGHQQVDATDCYLLTVTPTAEAATDWVVAQDQSMVIGGPSLYFWKTGWERSTEIYRRAYVDGRVKLWVAGKSLRILMAEIDLHFVAKPGNLLPSDLEGANPTDVPFDIVHDFHAQLHFSDYGQVRRITPAPEALAAAPR